MNSLILIFHDEHATDLNDRILNSGIHCLWNLLVLPFQAAHHEAILPLTLLLRSTAETPTLGKPKEIISSIVKLVLDSNIQMEFRLNAAQLLLVMKTKYSGKYLI
jgi:hypothetical protein